MLQSIASHLPSDEILGLKELFASMDVDKDGVITIDNLREALKQK